MSNEILDSLLKEYDRKKMKAENDLLLRKENLYNSIPRLQEIEDELLSIEHLEDYTLIAMMHHHLMPLRKDDFLKTKCKEKIVKVETGVFGAKMKVSLINDGPTTIIMEK